MAIWTAPSGKRVRGVPTLDALQPPTSDVTRITVSGGLDEVFSDVGNGHSEGAEMDSTAKIVPVIQLHGSPDLDQVEALLQEWAQTRSRSS